MHLGRGLGIQAPAANQYEVEWGVWPAQMSDLTPGIIKRESLPRLADEGFALGISKSGEGAVLWRDFRGQHWETNNSGADRPLAPNH